MDCPTRDGHHNSDAQGPTIISGKIGLHVLLELLCTCGTLLLASHAEIGVEKRVAERTAVFRGLVTLQTRENIVPEPNWTLIETESDVAAHRDPFELFSIEPQPSFRVEWHELVGRLALRE